MKEKKFQKRIGYEGELKPLLSKVCEDFNIGNYRSHRVITSGYEDFNLTLTTDKGKFFTKIFAAFRDLKECQRYIDVMVHVLEAGVQHPTLYESPQGFLHEVSVDDTAIRLCVMQFIDGKSFFELDAKPTIEEMQFLVQQAARINGINLKPTPLYDSWATVNFLGEYEKTKSYLNAEDAKLLYPLATRFAEVVIKDLPHAFVHGDMIATNVMKDRQGRIHVTDFAVANYYPRIVELAVLFCNMLFDENNPEGFVKNYKMALTEYQKQIPLTAMELEMMPLFVQVAHAMHVVRATYEKLVNGNESTENEYWLKIGKIGLRYTTSLYGRISKKYKEGKESE